MDKLTPRALQLLRRKARASLGLPATEPTKPSVIPPEPVEADTNETSSDSTPKSKKQKTTNGKSSSKSKEASDKSSTQSKGSTQKPKSKLSQANSVNVFQAQFKPSIEDLNDTEWNEKNPLPKLTLYPNFFGQFAKHCELSVILRIVKIFDFLTSYLPILNPNFDIDPYEFELFYASFFVSKHELSIFQLYIFSHVASTALELNFEEDQLPPLSFACSQSFIEKALKEIPNSKVEVSQFDFFELSFEMKLDLIEGMIDHIIDHKSFNDKIEAFELKRWDSKTNHTSIKKHITALEMSINDTKRSVTKLEAQLKPDPKNNILAESITKIQNELDLKKEWLNKKEDILKDKKEEFALLSKQLIRGFGGGVKKYPLQVPFEFYTILNLGQDRYGRIYWYWAFLGGLMIQHIDTNLTKADTWYYIDSPTTLNSLIDNLNRKAYRECPLFKNLARYTDEIISSFPKFKAWMEQCRTFDSMSRKAKLSSEMFIDRTQLFVPPVPLLVQDSSLDGQNNPYIKITRGVLEIESESKTINVSNFSESDLWFSPLDSYTPFDFYDYESYSKFMVKSISTLLDKLINVTFDQLTSLGLTGNGRQSKSLHLEAEEVESIDQMIFVVRNTVKYSLDRIKNYLSANQFVKDHYKVLALRKILQKQSQIVSSGKKSISKLGSDYLTSFASFSWWISKLILELDPNWKLVLPKSSNLKNSKNGNKYRLSACDQHNQGTSQLPCHRHYPFDAQIAKQMKFARVKIITNEEIKQYVKS